MNITLKEIGRAVSLALLVCTGTAQAGLVFLDVATDTAPNGVVNPDADPAKARKSFRDMLKPDSIKTDGFSSYAQGGDVTTLDMSATIGAALTSAGGSGGLETGKVVDEDIDKPVDGRFDTTGDSAAQWWLTQYGFTLDFGNAGVSALAFYGTDFGDFDGSFKLTLLTADDVANNLSGTSKTYFASATGQQVPANNGANNGWLSHFGFLDDTASYQRVVFEIGQNPNEVDVDFLGFDDFIVGELRDPTDPNPVPEPGSLALVGASLLALTAARRRRAGSNKA